MGGKGGGGGVPMMMPPQQDNSDLIMAMMETQNQQNQAMMNLVAQMMMADDNQPPVIVQPPQVQKQGYESDIQSLRDRIHEKAKKNVTEEAENRTGRSKTILSSPRLDSTKPKTKKETPKSLLSEDDDENK